MGKATAIVTFDLSKAFDAINHNILMEKLKIKGFKEPILDLLKSYLSNRSQYVKFNGDISEVQSLTHGVPQGSILGPVLFTIFIDDLKDIVTKCKVLNYADDTTIYCSSKSPSNLQAAMNEDLRNLEKWFRINKLKLNEAKTELIIINPQNKANLYNNVHIKVKNTIVQQAEHIKILGVTLTKNLKWDKHINSIIRNCKYHLRSFKRSIKYINNDERKILYNSCIAS